MPINGGSGFVQLNEEERRHPALQQFRDYVTADDETRYDGMIEGFIRLDISHSNLEQKWHDIMVYGNMTVLELKEKLYRHCGSSIGLVDLYLRRHQGGTVFLADERATLSYYGCDNGQTLHMVDNDPPSLSAGGALENVDLVQKYNMTDDDYDAREKTLRAYKKEQLKKDPTFQFLKKPVEAGKENVQIDMSVYVVGARCEVNPGGRRGEIKFVGPLTLPEEMKEREIKWDTSGNWEEKERKKAVVFLGVQLDEPLGHNDGSREGKHFFECPDKYGVFCKPDSCTVGDFPEDDPFAGLSDDDEI